MWHIQQDGGEYVLTGPVGDTLIVHLESDPLNPDDGIDWTGWTWTGGIVEERGGPVLYHCDFTDLSTADELNVIARIDKAITLTLDPDVDLWFGIRGSKSGDLLTYVEAIVRPYMGVLPNA